VSSEEFYTEHFKVRQDRCAMKIGTDSILLGSWAQAADGEDILDIGCGTGIIALMMAERFPHSHVDAIDIDGDAAEQASENFADSPYAQRMKAYKSSVQEYRPEIKVTTISELESNEGKYGAIVCNPPFFVDSLTCPDDKRTTARHTLSLSFSDLAHAAFRLLAYGGLFSVVIPTDSLADFEAKAIIAGFIVKRICYVRTTATKPPKRVLVEFSNKPMTNPTTTSTQTPTPQAPHMGEWRAILSYFRQSMPNADTELHFASTFQLLVAVILSAQCTDKRVNMVTPELFQRYPTAEKMAEATPDELLDYISSVSYPNSKAAHLAGMAKDLVEKYGGEVPSDFDALLSLPGVGRKTANVIQAVAFGKSKMAVDTHVFRVSHRIGLVSESANTPLKVEMELMKNIPEEEIPRAHHWFILHGRYVCTARNPKCDKCGISQFCKTYLSS